MSKPTLPARSWELWHPKQGIAFSSRLYPALDVARLLSTAPLRASFNDPRVHDAALPPKIVDSSKPADHSPSSAAQSSTEAGETPLPPPAVDDGGNTSDGAPDSAPDSAPFTPLSYKIPDETFRAAALAAPDTSESFWSYSMYRGPHPDLDEDGSEIKVKVHYCKSAVTTERVLKLFLEETVIGFDLEWSAQAMRFHGPRANVSLFQIASERRIALFHLAMYPAKDDLVTPLLKQIMEDPEITKAGVNIKGDCTRLRNHLGIEPRGTFELSHLYKLVRHSQKKEYGLINRRLVSLATQVNDVLGLPMFKGQDVRASDWSQPLKMEQIIYSASDAYAAVHLYHILDHEREALDPCPPMPHHAELGLPIRFAAAVMEESSDEEDSDPDLELKEEDKVPAQLSQEFIAEAGENVSFEAESDSDSEADCTPSKPITKQATGPAPKATANLASKPRDSRVEAAEAWLQEWRKKHDKIKVQPAALRAYRMWYTNADLDPDSIAALLREPPLKITTVISYILEPIRLAKQPYDPARLRKEVLGLLDSSVVEKRYASLWKATEPKGTES